jgi:hypothetical protein
VGDGALTVVQTEQPGENPSGSVGAFWHAGPVNESARDIRFASFEVTVRPARAVYLVDATPGADRAGVRRAIQEASTRWGGACEPIVLVGEDGAVDERDRVIVGLARVDGAVNVNLPLATANTAAETLELPLVPLSAIDTYGPVIGTCNPGAVGDFSGVDGGSNGFLLARLGGKLWESAAAGDLTEEHEQRLESHVLSVSRPAFSNDEIGRAQVWPRTSTLAERTLHYFGENHAEINPCRHPTVLWVAREDAVRDCVEFWNVRALRPTRLGDMPMILLPEDEVEHWVKFDEQVRAALRRPNEFEPDVVLVSRSVPPGDLAAFAARFDLVATDMQPRPRPIPSGQPDQRTAPFTYAILEDLLPWVSFARSYGYTTSVAAAVYDGKASLEFTSPVPFTLPGMTSLVVGGPAMASLPRRPAVAAMVKQTGRWRDNGLQVTTQAQALYRHEITVPSLAEATRAVLEEAAARWQLSDKGAVGAGLLESTQIEVLLEPAVFEVLLALTTPRAKTIAKEIAKALGKQVADLTDAQRALAERWHDRAERQFRSATSASAPGVKLPDRVTALERLAGIGWAERGLQSVCPACRLKAFQPLHEQHARGHGRCPGCGAQAPYSVREGNAEIVYRLDSGVDRAADQGVLAHLLTVAALRRIDPGLYLLPGVDVWFAGEKDKKEFDLYGIMNGKLVAGEVKQTAADFDEKQVRGDIDKSARLGVDIHVMAAPGEIDATSLDLARKLCTRAGLELMILQRAQLRPGTPTPEPGSPTQESTVPWPKAGRRRMPPGLPSVPRSAGRARWWRALAAEQCEKSRAATADGARSARRLRRSNPQ